MIVNLIKGRKYFTAESKKDFSGWEILMVSDYKPRVKRLYIRKDIGIDSADFRIVYCENKHVPTEFKKICI